MGLQDVADRSVGDLVADVGQSVGNAVVTPGRILASPLEDQIDDLLRRGWPAHGTTLVAVVPLLCHEFPMPAKNRVRREEAADLFQELTPQSLAFDG